MSADGRSTNSAQRSPGPAWPITPEALAAARSQAVGMAGIQGASASALALPPPPSMSHTSPPPFAELGLLHPMEPQQACESGTSARPVDPGYLEEDKAVKGKQCTQIAYPHGNKDNTAFLRNGHSEMQSCPTGYLHLRGTVPLPQLGGRGSPQPPRREPSIAKTPGRAARPTQQPGQVPPTSSEMNKPTSQADNV